MRSRFVLGPMLVALVFVGCSSAGAPAGGTQSTPASPASAAAAPTAAPAAAAAAPTAATGATGAGDACAVATKEPTTAYRVLGGTVADSAKYPDPVPSTNQGQSVCTFVGQRGTLTFTLDTRPEAKTAFEAAKSQAGTNAMPLTLGADDTYAVLGGTDSTYFINSLKGGAALYVAWKVDPQGHEINDPTLVLTKLKQTIQTLQDHL